MSSESSWPEEFTEGFARGVRKAEAEDERLQRGVDMVVELIGGCEHAGVMILSRREVRTVAATDDVVRQGDRWQYEFDEGPCLDSVREAGTVISQNLRTEARWSRWTPRVLSELGVESMLSLLLYTEQDTLGALNLYGDRADVWDHEQVSLAQALASHLAMAAADAREIENRGRAMVNRTVIGQAEGILMERFDIDADRAFAFLRRISQDSNRKLNAVAQELVDTRTLTELDASGPGD